MQKTSWSTIVYFLRQHIMLAQAVFLAVVTIIMILGVASSFFARANEAQRELEQKKTALKEMSDQVVFLTNLDANVLKTRMELLDAVLPPTKDVILYLLTIDGLSRELSLSLRGVQLSPGELATASATAKNSGGETKVAGSVQGMRSLDTQLMISGAQDSIYAFLRAIEQAAPLMRVKDVKVSRVAEEGFNLSVTLSMLYAEPSMASGLSGKTALFTDEEEAVLKQIAQFKTYKNVSIAGQQILVPTGKADLFQQNQQNKSDSQ